MCVLSSATIYADLLYARTHARSPVNRLAPILVDVGAELNGQIRIAKVDTDKYPNLGTRFGVEGLPTMCLFRDGKEVHRLMGMYNKDQLIAELKPYM
jgi:thioredoxin-like negative regulator of GroEL